MPKAKTGLSGTIRKPPKAKTTRQGHGQRSLPYKGKQHRKLSRGQGR
jgi:hypothetical protein